PYVKPSICVIQGEKEHILAGTPVRGGGGAGSLDDGGELTPDNPFANAKPAYPSAHELFHAHDSACASSRHKSLWDD
ncbi:MAG: hypothetical protein ACI4T9_05790, partial [Prevotella sp.]